MASWFWLSGGLAVICFMFFLFSLVTSMSFIQHAKEPRSILKETLLSWLMLLYLVVAGLQSDYCYIFR